MSGWSSGLRRQTQGIDPSLIEISGPRMRAWVRIPLLTKTFFTYFFSRNVGLILSKQLFQFIIMFMVYNFDEGIFSITLVKSNKSEFSRSIFLFGTAAESEKSLKHAILLLES